MNEPIPASPAPTKSASPPGVSTSPPGTSNNSRQLRVFPGRPIITIEPIAEPVQASAPPPALVVDPALEEDDLRVEIGMSVFGRTKKLAEFRVDRTIYGGAQPQGRETFFHELDEVLEEVYESGAIRVNRKLNPENTEQKPANGARQSPRGDELSAESNHQGEELLLTEPLPLPPDGTSWDEFLANMPSSRVRAR